MRDINRFTPSQLLVFTTDKMKDVNYYLTTGAAELAALLADVRNPITNAMAASILANPVFAAAIQEMIADLIVGSPA
jgi:hypothetical protein